MRALRRLAIPIALGALTLTPIPLHAQSPGDRVAAIQREHGDSLSDLCRALDAELLGALPAWSDGAFRWAAFGVPTDEERLRLRTAARELSDLLTAMQPVIEERLREADASNEPGIEQAVQFSTVLVPLARARALLLYGVAVDPVVGLSDESRRAFEEARRVAERAESVSAWSDAERELVVALASIRLADTERSVEAIRTVRDAFRENRELTESAPGALASLRAAETLLVAVARSPVEARGSMPEDAADVERLRLRLAAIAASRASTPDQRSRILAAEADRLAGEALNIATGSTVEDLSWSAPLERTVALLGPTTGGRSGAAAALLEASRALGRDTPQEIGAILGRTDLGPLSPLGSVVELLSLTTATPDQSDVAAIARVGLDIDRLVEESPLRRSALDRAATALRAALTQADTADVPQGDDRDVLIDFLDTLALRTNAGRSNLDLLAAVVVPRGVNAGPETITLIEAAETLARTARQTQAADPDALRALTLAGASLCNAIARNQIASVLEEAAIDSAAERRAATVGSEIASQIRGVDPENGLASILVGIGLLADDQPGEAMELLGNAQSPLVASWTLDSLRAQSALRSGTRLDQLGASDGVVFGAMIFVHRHIEPALDVRASVPGAGRTPFPADAAVASGSLLIGRSDTATRLAIRSLSGALRSDSQKTLGAVAKAARDALASVSEPVDRTWLMIIGAEADLRTGDDAAAFGTLRTIVGSTPPEDRSGRSYWHASMRMLEILDRQNVDGSRTPAIAREIRRLRLQPSWHAHTDICERIDAVAARIVGPG